MKKRHVTQKGQHKLGYIEIEQSTHVTIELYITFTWLTYRTIMI